MFKEQQKPARQYAYVHKGGPVRRHISAVAKSVAIGLCLFVIVGGKTVVGEIRLIQAGDPFPETPLLTPGDIQARQYLGLGQDQFFTLNDIKADLVLVEVLSVHCPTCQRQAQAYNELFESIRQNPDIKDRIKMIGVGAGNNAAEIDYFKRNYDVPFPIIPDPRFNLHEAIGGSRTPFTIYVRHIPEEPSGIVVDTHLGENDQIDRLLNELEGILSMDAAAIRRESRDKKRDVIVMEPVFTESELRTRLNEIFADIAGQTGSVEKIDLDGVRQVYTSMIEQDGIPQRIFVEVVSRPPACVDCHDLHFAYVFDAAGKILDFVPLLLTKYGNETWSKADIRRMWQQVVGKSITAPFIFDPKVDAISSATITSAMIYDSLSKGEALLSELKQKGWI